MAKFWNIFAAGTFLVLSLVLGAQAWLTPASPFDPIGSGLVPFVTAALLAIICTFAGARDLRRSNAPDAASGFDGSKDTPVRTHSQGLAPILLCVLTLGFAASLQGKLAPLPVLIFLFLGLAGLVLAWPISRRSALVVQLVVAVGLAMGLEVIFTQFLYIRFN